VDTRPAAQVAERIVANVERVLVGKRTEVELAVAALLAGGHLLIEDVPGVGKTLLARALAQSVGGSFKRIQFTPDLLPSDVTGVSVFDQRSGAFVFRPGPVFAQVVLADEINRSTPKTQSALLEAMEERQVSADGETHRLAGPFLVVATQNPVEYEGTFPLPEAQLDRFLLRLRIGYPAPADELAILRRADGPGANGRHPVEHLPPVATLDELVAAQLAARAVHTDPLIHEYVVALVGATRAHPRIRLGASPRGSLALLHASQAWALLRGRDYLLPDDVKRLAEPVLAHRLIVAHEARFEGSSASALVGELLAEVPVPGALPGRAAARVRP
jgi:MoxR-like ATPase